MATSELEKWVNTELMSLLGIDLESIECITTYLISITDEEELTDYVKEFLTGSSDASKLNGPQKEFLRELVIRWKRILVPENMIVYKKDKDQSNKPKMEKYQLNKSSTQSNNPFDMSKVGEDLSKLSPSKKGTKKATYVSLYGKDGKLKTNAVMLPGRNSCECQAQKHRLVSNCLGCGRVVCQQEGSGPCLFCGELVCTKEEKEILSKHSKKSEKLHYKLISVPGGSALTTAANDEKVTSALEKAREYKERLLNYDRTCVQRTRVIDDEADYYATDSNIWLSEKERKYLQKKQEEIREIRHGSRLNKKFTLDFAGREVREDTVDDYDATDDPELMAANFGGDYSESFSNIPLPSDDKENFPGLVNPSIKGENPIFVPTELSNSVEKVETVWSKPNNRLQDKQLLEMSDPGMCLSMHQPWASLLVCGIKLDEGRSWYSNHRGRLWIAAAAKQQSKEVIKEVEKQHLQQWEALQRTSEMPPFPKDYPVGCLLGCVDVKDVLSHDDYIKSHPLGESGSAYVFVCENPHELSLKFPVKGRHKIWKLEPKLHRTAKGTLMY